jgi:hypothetical protein
VDGVRDSRDTYPLPDRTSTRSEVSFEPVRHDDAEMAAAEAVSTDLGRNEVNTGSSDSSNTRDLLNSRIVDQSEIPNTPTQRSSQVEGDIATLHIQALISPDINRPDVKSSDRDAPQVEEITIIPMVTHVLCVGCHMKHVLSNKSETATW